MDGHAQALLLQTEGIERARKDWEEGGHAEDPALPRPEHPVGMPNYARTFYNWEIGKLEHKRDCSNDVCCNRHNVHLVPGRTCYSGGNSYCQNAECRKRFEAETGRKTRTDD